VLEMLSNTNLTCIIFTEIKERDLNCEIVKWLFWGFALRRGAGMNPFVHLPHIFKINHIVNQLEKNVIHEHFYSL